MGADGIQIVIRPEDVLAPAVRGRRLGITADSCDTSQLRILLQREFPEEASIDDTGADNKEETNLVLDLLVHEATSHSSQGDAETREKGHTTAKAAAEFAGSIGVRQLVLTHFSQRFVESMEGKGMFALICSISLDLSTLWQLVPYSAKL